MKTVLSILTATALTGCGAMAEAYFTQVQQNIDHFVGHPVDYAIEYLGYPAREQTVAGHHLYIWERSKSGSYNTYVPTTTQTPYGPIYGQAVSTNHYDYNCTVMLEVDKKNVVTKASFEGDIGGCQPYAKLKF